MIKEVNWV